jgi:hypothetical protein
LKHKYSVKRKKSAFNIEDKKKPSYYSAEGFFEAERSKNKD